MAQEDGYYAISMATNWTADEDFLLFEITFFGLVLFFLIRLLLISVKQLKN